MGTYAVMKTYGVLNVLNNGRTGVNNGTGVSLAGLGKFRDSRLIMMMTKAGYACPLLDTLGQLN